LFQTTVTFVSIDNSLGVFIQIAYNLEIEAVIH